ncbi:hypothetical protein GOV11_04820 [Candidatus Woesearchaeota archaeon]|nr:hypothetical protein [Candidatus Woesearchaeota archaeon]
MLMPLLFWVTVAAAVTVVFWAAWRMADRIDREEQYESKWAEYIAHLERTDPQQANYMKQMKQSQEEGRQW